jgi:peptidoglycan/LPS O-acetylase OafA/YrhL
MVCGHGHGRRNRHFQTGLGVGTVHQSNNFDGLRLIAAWLVLVSHSWELLGPSVGPDPLARGVGIDTLGAVAVIIFFAVSGYLVTQSLQRCASASDFIWRRAIRIFPALWFVLLGSLLIIGPLFTFLPQADFWSHTSIKTYLGGWILRVRPGHLPGVFEGNPFPSTINGSLWTLPLEVRMYGLLALIAFAPRTWWRRLMYGFIALFVVLTLVHLIKTPVRRLPYFSEMSVFVVKLGGAFAFGAAVAFFHVGLSAIIVGLLCLIFRLIPAAQMAAAILFPLAVAWFALSVGKASWPVLSRLGQRGDFSYGVYLWAYPMQQIVIALFKPETPWQLMALATAFTLPMAWVSWTLIESPALQLKDRPFLRRR